MSELKKRHPRRSDEEWISLIQECRASGLTDREWCELHHIQTSKFYYHIRRLRAKACNLPDNPRVQSQSVHHEIVKLDLNEFSQNNQRAENLFSVGIQSSQMISNHLPTETSFRSEDCTLPAVHVSFGNISIAIHNSADRSTILNTLSALQSLC